VRRRRQPQSNDSRDRWLISYADFITLLFAFFVVMYSISSVNEGKYKVLSETLEGVFNTRQKSLEPIQVGELSHKSATQETTQGLNPLLVGRHERYESAKDDLDNDQLEEVAGEFEDSFADLIFEDKLSISLLDNWVEITLRDDVVFESGGAIPSEASFDVIRKIASILKGRHSGLLIEGHTDNKRISNSQYDSNWELSTARAVTFLRLLSIEGIAEARMAAIGFGEFHPIVRNDTPQGRSQNRRIVVLVSRSGDLRTSLIN